MPDNGGSMLRAKMWVIYLLVVVAYAVPARGQSLPKVRAAYTSISIQFNPVYIMKELDLPRKYGLDVEVLFVPVSSRALQAALAGEIQFHHQRRRGQYQRQCDGRRLRRPDGDAQYFCLQNPCGPRKSKSLNS